MIIKIKAYPSHMHKGEYFVMGSRVIHVKDCEQIHVDTGESVVVYVRAPVPSTGESCCYNCHLSPGHKGRIRGICANLAGCGTHQMHYKEANDPLEDI